MVRNLTYEEMNVGEHSVYWHCLDDNCNDVPSGVYYYNLKMDSEIVTGRLVNLK